MADLMLIDQENVTHSRKLTSTTQKRHLRNTQFSASKRPALQSITNNYQYVLTTHCTEVYTVYISIWTIIYNILLQEDVTLPAHLDPLLGLPSSIPSFSDSLSFTSLPSPGI